MRDISLCRKAATSYELRATATSELVIAFAERQIADISYFLEEMLWFRHWATSDAILWLLEARGSELVAFFHERYSTTD